MHSNKLANSVRSMSMSCSGLGYTPQRNYARREFDLFCTGVTGLLSRLLGQDEEFKVHLVLAPLHITRLTTNTEPRPLPDRSAHRA